MTGDDVVLDTALDRDDPLAALLREGRPKATTGEIEDGIGEDGEPTGYRFFVPKKDEEARMAAYLAEEYEIARENYSGVWSAAEENLLSYHALSESDELLTIPIVKRDVNQIISFLINRIMNKRPIATVDPDEIGMIEVPVPAGNDPLTGEVMSRMELKAAEEIAENGERLMDHYLRKRIPFRRFVSDIITDCVRGLQPAWGKTCYEPNDRVHATPKFQRGKNGLYRMSGMQHVNREMGSPHKLLAKSVFDVLMPSDELDPQESPWIAERNTMSITRFRQAYDAGEFPHLTPEKAAKVIAGAKDLSSSIVRPGIRGHDGRAFDRARGQLDIWNFWTYWPIMLDVEGEMLEGLFSLLIPFDVTTSTILASPLNPYGHGLRPLREYFMRQEPHQFAGGSTGADTVPFQRSISTLFQLQIKNAALANTIALKVRPGSKAWTWLQHNPFRSGSRLPADQSSDVETLQIGSNYRSLSPEIGALDSLAKETNVVSDAFRGASMGSRTAAAAISLVQEASSSQPLTFLDNLREGFGVNLSMLYAQLGQYSIYGETIPFRNPETKKLTELAVQFPADGNAGFTVNVTASSDEETTQFQFEQTLGLSKVFAEHNKLRAEMLGPMIDAKATPAMIAANRKMFLGGEKIIARLSELARLDARQFTFSEKELDEIVDLQAKWMEIMKQMQAMQQQLAQAQQQITQLQTPALPPGGGPFGPTGGPPGGAEVIPFAGAGGGGNLPVPAPPVAGGVPGMAAPPGEPLPVGPPQAGQL